jgi:hypothetical protein
MQSHVWNSTRFYKVFAEVPKIAPQWKIHCGRTMQPAMNTGH